MLPMANTPAPTAVTVRIPAAYLWDGIDIQEGDTFRHVFIAVGFEDATPPYVQYRVTGPEPSDARIRKVAPDSVHTVRVPDVSGIPADSDALRELDAHLAGPGVADRGELTPDQVELAAQYGARGDADLLACYRVAPRDDLAWAYRAYRRGDAAYLRIAAAAAPQD